MDEFRKPRKPRRTPKDATAKARVAEDAVGKVATLEFIRLKIEAPGGSVEIPVRIIAPLKNENNELLSVLYFSGSDNRIFFKKHWYNNITMAHNCLAQGKLF